MAITAFAQLERSEKQKCQRICDAAVLSFFLQILPDELNVVGQEGAASSPRETGKQHVTLQPRQASPKYRLHLLVCLQQSAPEQMQSHLSVGPVLFPQQGH